MNVVPLNPGFEIDLEDDLAVAGLLHEQILPADIADAVRQADVARIIAGRYEVGDVIGQGATSTVCRGRDLLFNCPVAIKLLDPPTDTIGERATHIAIGEARMVRRINSQHVVRVHDAGIHEVRVDNKKPFSVPYIVMDLEMETDGDAEYAAAALSSDAYKPRSLKEALRWVRDAALGAAAAHRVGVHHLDIKPLNLLVEPVSRRGKLIDFGVPATGSKIAGTPAYMAPELARAMLEKDGFDQLDRCKLDVFALGALAYHLVYGETLVAPTGDVETELRVVADAKPAVLEDKRTLWGNVSERVSKILRRALAPEPSDRYVSVADLAEDVDSWLEGLPLIEERKQPLRRFWLWCYRVRKPLAIVSLAFAGIIVLSIVALLLSTKVTMASQELDGVEKQVAAKEHELALKEQEVASAKQQIDKKQKLIETKQKQLENLTVTSQHDVAELSAKLALNVDGNHQLTLFAGKLEAQNKKLAGQLQTTQGELQSAGAELATTKDELGRETKALDDKSKAYDDKSKALDDKNKAYDEKSKAFDDKTKAYDEKTRALSDKTKALDEKTKAFDEKAADLVKAHASLDSANRDLASVKAELAVTKGKLQAETAKNVVTPPADPKLVDPKVDPKAVDPKADSR
jgi:serine/threonine protein kinase